MFIVWGTKVVRKVRGRMAEFCRLCRDFRPHRVAEVQSVGHLYYIPIGRGQTHGFERTCEACGLVQAMPPEHGAPALSRDRHADAEALLAETNPEGPRLWADRIAFEERARSGALTADERRAALLEPFLLANTLLERRAQRMHLDLASGLGCLATVAGFVAVLSIASTFVRAGSEAAVGVAFAVGGALALVTLILLATDGRRYARRVLLPVVVRALRPLRPSQEEIGATLEDLKVRRVKLGKSLKADALVDALNFAFD